LIQEEMDGAERILQLPPAEQRSTLHRTLDRAETDDDGLHDACMMLTEVGDASSVPHLIRALRFFGSTELPLPEGAGIVCTQQHCVDALEHITGEKPGISYGSWKRWWEAAHPGQPLDDPPDQRIDPTAGTAPSMNEPVEVEFARVEGKRCLQPVLVHGDPGESDYIPAEQRWLEEHYPGHSVTYQMYFLGTDPGTGPARGSPGYRPSIDRIDFVTADGKSESVCFSLGVSSF
jgi:hypothetical protein